MMKPIVAFALALLLAVLAGGPAPSAQTPRLSRVMREKLEHSKNILEGLVTSNWQQIERESLEIAKATQDPAWTVLKMPEYVRQSDTFLRATDGLIDAARRRDLEGASLGYVSLTTSCVSCHRFVARARIAR